MKKKYQRKVRQHGLNFVARNPDIEGRSEKNRVRKFVKYVNKVLNFFNGEMKDELQVTRDLLKYQYTHNKEAFVECEKIWSKEFVQKTNKMIKEDQYDKTVVLKRALMSLIADLSVRQGRNARFLVCIIY